MSYLFLQYWREIGFDSCVDSNTWRITNIEMIVTS